ncbi:hypothetical protein RCG24_03075 [Neobacillus sp. OS1-32]|uniref:hypothetical protein n=1 Tax=Neobacillus TaxID=2675232 RepID=UPI001F322DE1|nr:MULTISPECIES: hypothetical protein [Neobacillus]WML30903.1 hypothetical protein RCG24_03075 [Neobacillus sp. OS1-32]
MTTVEVPDRDKSFAYMVEILVDKKDQAAESNSILAFEAGAEKEWAEQYMAVGFVGTPWELGSSFAPGIHYKSDSLLSF